jgi:hypothetical protein
MDLATVVTGQNRNFPEAVLEVSTFGERPPCKSGPGTFTLCRFLR